MVVVKLPWQFLPQSLVETFLGLFNMEPTIPTTASPPQTPRPQTHPTVIGAVYHCALLQAYHVWLTFSIERILLNRVAAAAGVPAELSAITAVKFAKVATGAGLHERRPIPKSSRSSRS